jgi:hypothetical protein
MPAGTLHRLGSGERALGIDEPLCLAEPCEEGGEGVGVGKRRLFAEQGELAGGVGGGEFVQHPSAE